MQNIYIKKLQIKKIEKYRWILNAGKLRQHTIFTLVVLNLIFASKNGTLKSKQIIQFKLL